VAGTLSRVMRHSVAPHAANSPLAASALAVKLGLNA
jgi:hypothetical protein